VDTSGCAHFGHHPHLTTLRPDGTDRLSITHKFSSNEETELDIGETG
jgi:hypothetical protein